jgi:hypothetical protein
MARLRFTNRFRVCGTVVLPVEKFSAIGQQCLNCLCQPKGQALRANITMTYGVRYDVYRPPNANENSPFEYSRSFRTDKNNVAPRLGFAVGLGRTVVRASGGIFYDPFQTDLYRRALLNNGTPAFFAISATPQLPFAPPFPTVFSGLPQGFPSTLQDITTVSPDFASLYSLNANVSITREIAKDLALTATYLFTRGNRLPVMRNINLVRPANNWPTVGPFSAPGAHSRALETSSLPSRLANPFTTASTLL